MSDPDWVIRIFSFAPLPFVDPFSIQDSINRQFEDMNAFQEKLNKVIEAQQKDATEALGRIK